MNRRKRARSGSPLSLGEQAFDLIKGDIILCKLKPGRELTEIGVAEQYRFGRAPVRAALSKLAQEGLVSVMARRGYVVSPITVKAVQEVFDLRLVLEPMAVRAAAGKVDIAKLRSLNVHPGTPNHLEFIRSNRAFHAAIIEAASNQRLVRILSSLFDEMDRLLHLGLFSERDAVVMQVNHEEQAQQHAAIIDALARGDAQAAAQATEEHVASSRELVLRAILSGRLAFSV